MRVICEAGYSACDYPKSFFWQENNLAVKRIDKEWREPDAKHYLVTAANGSQFKFVFSETSGRWSIFEVSNSPIS